MIGKYGDNANILDGIPMIADDMMSFIKNDILVLSRFYFYFIYTLDDFKKHKMGNYTIIGCTVSVILMVGFLGFVDGKSRLFRQISSL